MAEGGLTIMDITKLKVPELKKELKNRGLNISGNKNELIERLQNALKSNDVTGQESVDDLDEDLLNDDFDEPTESNESVITDIDKALNEPVSPTKSIKRKINNDKLSTDSSDSNTQPPPKKVILNRNISITTDARVSTESKEGSDKTNGSTENGKKVIKLSEISVKERLEMRAKKFDVAISTDAKKLARAERFSQQLNNLSSSANNSNSKVTITAGNGAGGGGGGKPSLDVLKQRAERFGGSVSSAMSKIEIQEKLERRKARFGIVNNTNKNLNKTLSQNEKAKQRLERFKQPVK